MSRFIHRLLPVLLLLAPALRAENRLYIANQQVGVGGSGIPVPIRLDSDDPVHGFQISLVVDSSRLRVRSFTLEGGVAASAEFSDGVVAADGQHISWGAVMEFLAPFDDGHFIPAGRAQILGSLLVDVQGTEETSVALRFRRRGDDPPAVNKLVREEGVEVPLVTGDAEITIRDRRDRFGLGFSGPARLTGVPGSTVAALYFATLSHSGDGAGAEGWSIGFTADGARISAVSLAETAASLLRNGFELSELTTGAGNEGAVSAVVLSLREGTSLPPNGTHEIARLRLEATIPSGTGPAVLRHVDGLRGSGQPVINSVTQQGRPFVPDLGRLDLERVGVPGGFVRGDVNGDGALNITDPTFILGFLFLGTVSRFECDKTADADDDGGINLTDAIHLLNFLFLGGPPPPAPHSSCGSDPTPDPLTCPSFRRCQ